jgi:Xaa-Pro aminopeptidase
MTSYHDRLVALREALSRQQLDGFIIATGDEHITEFVAPYAQRLAWLSGFTGSTASIAVLADEAAIFVDGRYTVAVRSQVDGADWSYEDVPQTSVGQWLAGHARRGARIGYDAKLYTRNALRMIEDRLTPAGIELVPVTANPIDPLWTDQPARPSSAAFVHGLEFAGKSSVDKRREVGDWLASIDADACALVALDSIAWLFNLRGDDIYIVPLNYAFAICHRDGTADLFIDQAKIDDTVRQHLGNSVRIAPYEDVHDALVALGGKTVSVDPNLSPMAIYAALERGGAKVRDDRDPTQLPKAIKNPTEIAAFKEAARRDSAALIRFFHWFSAEAPKGELTELSAAAKLNSLRREVEGYHSLSFDPISAADANAALPHYWPTPESDARIGPDSIYLVDSGGQYPGGTTDVTRTVAVGTARAEVKDRFTRVLKGHIALDTTRFPKGTLGSRLDPIARRSLWDAGVDYGHGTGHGVGAFLNVHEGPAYFLAATRPGEAGIEAGMVLTNEPGYYKAGDFGIRTENQLVVVEQPVAGAEATVLAFESMTLVPMDRKLLDFDLLTDAEMDWLDRYHARVRESVSPLLPADTRAWLERETAPIRDIRSSHIPELAGEHA